jgi:hypothetical protein
MAPVVEQLPCLGVDQAARAKRVQYIVAFPHLLALVYGARRVKFTEIPRGRQLRRIRKRTCERSLLMELRRLVGQQRSKSCEYLDTDWCGT